VRAVDEEGWAQEATKLIGDLLERELHDRRLTAELRTFAAQQFLHMIVALPQRRTMGLGVPMTAPELERWADNAVRLFLDGCRGLSGPGPRRAR
jgi:hypothetical protein